MAEALLFELAWIENNEGYSIAFAQSESEAQTYKQLLDSTAVRDLISRLGWSQYRWSVFGKKRELTDRAGVGDRIELLPGLQVDPKIARRRRAAHRLRTQRAGRKDC
jgi:putative ubiquitin-RnfH superfamily antitoxin RatB of RatAB toxin-antitoxin module